MGSLRSMLELERENRRLCDQLVNHEQVSEQLREKYHDAWEKCALLQHRLDEALSGIDCLGRENQILACRLSEQIEVAGRLKLDNDKMSRELEDLSRSLFEEAHRIVDKEVEARKKSDQKCEKAERALETTTRLLKTHKAELQTLRSQISMLFPISSGAFKGKSRVSVWEEISPALLDRLLYPNSLDLEQLVPVLNSMWSGLAGTSFDYAWLIDQLDSQHYDDFQKWLETLEPHHEDQTCMDSPFMKQVLDLDVYPTLDFLDDKHAYARAAMTNTMSIELLHIEDSQSRCFLCARLIYRHGRRSAFGLWTGEQQHLIDSFCRNKLASICDLFGFIRNYKLGVYSDWSPFRLYFWWLCIKRNMFYARTSPTLFVLGDIHCIFSAINLPCKKPLVETTILQDF